MKAHSRIRSRLIDTIAVMTSMTADSLREEGFVGFVPLSALTTAHVPNEGGVYVVLRTAVDDPEFLEESTGGRFKNRDPSVTLTVLQRKWLATVPVLYIGKGDSLAERLQAFAAFGRGSRVGHWGGRLIWQLTDSAELVVAWKVTPPGTQLDVEKALIRRFRDLYGSYPFANWRV